MTRATGFWDRRRAGVAAESEAEQAALDAETLAEEHAALAEKSEAEILAELDLPDPDTMEMGDDFSAFMGKAVPEALRRRALRTLWRSNPVLANVDMLVDYGEDFTDSAMVIENMQTTYQVGKGMLKHVQEMARKAEELANPPEIEAPEQDDETPEAIEEDAPDVVLAEAPPEEPEVEEPYTTPAPRRMKFKVEATA